MPTIADSWDPDQYRRFAVERAQPFWDLVALAQERLDPTRPVRRAVDLGCGDGALTREAFSRLGVIDGRGIDSAPAMVAAAALAVPDLPVERSDIAAWTSGRDHDLVIANASLQWVPDHPSVLARWADALAPGGVLLVQVPANHRAPSHTVADAVATTEPYRSALGVPPADPVAANVLQPAEYARLLVDLGLEDVHVRLQVYVHRLESSRAVVQWTRGTTLNRYKNLLPPPMFERFVIDYEEALIAEIGDVAPYTFLFDRILMAARYGAHS